MIIARWTQNNEQEISVTATALDYRKNPVDDAVLGFSLVGEGKLDCSSGRTGIDGTTSFKFRSAKNQQSLSTITINVPSQPLVPEVVLDIYVNASAYNPFTVGVSRIGSLDFISSGDYNIHGGDPYDPSLYDPDGNWLG